MRDLKPCPFCGCKAMVFGGGNSSRGRLPSRVECASRLCMASTREAQNSEIAANIWNTRTELANAKLRGGEAVQSNDKFGTADRKETP